MSHQETGQKPLTEAEMQKFEMRARSRVDRLAEVAAYHERKYPGTLDVVHIHSGPGLFDQPLKPGQPEWQRKMDHDRFFAGAAVAREDTAVRLRRQGITVNVDGHDIPIRTTDLTQEQIRKSGPYILYNGVPVENEAVRRNLDRIVSITNYPPDKIIISDTVGRTFGNRTDRVPIAHTGHQMQDLFEQLKDPASPLYGKFNLAIVAHIPHIAVRVPHYIQTMYEQTGYDANFYLYGLRERKVQERTAAGTVIYDAHELHTDWEIDRLKNYVDKSLSRTPYHVYY